MPASQPDVFGTPEPPANRPNPEFVALVRARLHAKLALVKAAQVMPWPDQITIIHEDNGFRFDKDVLPPEEGAALWAEFNVEMDRLYAIMNEGKEPDLDD